MKKLVVWVLSGLALLIVVLALALRGFRRPEGASPAPPASPPSADD